MSYDHKPTNKGEYLVFNMSRRLIVQRRLLEYKVLVDSLNSAESTVTWHCHGLLEISSSSRITL